MKGSSRIVAFLLLVPALVLAQDIAPNLVKGSKAMLFSFNGFSSLGARNFDGGIGVKYFLKDKTALRVGLQIATASTDIPANPAPGQQGTDGKESGSRVGISAALELHRGSGRVSAYWGGGIGFTTTSTESKSAVVGNPPGNQTIVKNDRNGELVNGVSFFAGTGFNLAALAGVEFFLFKEVSLAAEYRLGFSRLSRADQETTFGNQTTKTKIGSSRGFGITNDGVLTLSVYF